MTTTDDKRPIIRLYTDGACIDNPGPGGWAYILKHSASSKSKEGSGGEHDSTNNRMEITAVIRGLEALKNPSIVELFSDSQYVVQAINDWMAKWKRKGWKKSGEPLKNLDLWRRLDELMATHQLKATWVRGHVGHAENERCDELATKAAAAIAKTPKPVKEKLPDVKAIEDRQRGLFDS